MSQSSAQPLNSAPALRDYARINIPVHGSRFELMRLLTDSFWDVLASQGVSWIGFYLGAGQSMEDGRIVGPQEMLLGPCRNKPACSPIGLHGVCGRGWREQRGIVVRDVAVLGADYVACDPRDKSEVVIPLFDPAGACWGVLDVDSWEVGAFNERDARVLGDILARAGLTAAPAGLMTVTL
jgi:putative methionine-R-sulfoxide reductase with GAF domain